MIIKIAGIMLVFLASTFTGICLSARFKKRIQILEGISEIIISIKIMIESQSLTVEELFSSLAKHKKLDNFFIPKEAFLCHNYKRRVETECNKNTILKEEDKRLFTGFINGLGTTYLDGQISIINGYIKQFDNKITKLKSEQNTKCRMYNSFGVLIGAFISIILS